MSDRDHDTDGELRRALVTASESWQPDVANARLELRRRTHPPTDGRQALRIRTVPVWLAPLSVASAAAALIAGILVVPQLLGPSQPETNSAAAQPTGSLTFTRQDGSTFEVDDFTVRCSVAGEPPFRRQVITVESPFVMDGASSDLAEPFAQLEAVVDDVAEPGTTIAFPYEAPGFQERRGELPAARVFAVDVETDNELSSNEKGSTGNVVFKRATCAPDVDIEVVIDATLGSEVGMETVEVSGTLRLER